MNAFDVASKAYDVAAGAQTLIAAAIGAFIAWKFNQRKNDLDEKAFKRDLFFRFNSRYAELNNYLENGRIWELETEVRSLEGSTVSLEDHWIMIHREDPPARSAYVDAVYDYLNMCSEQHYWYKKKFVDEEVWSCWQSGMKSWYDKLYVLKKVVEDESNQKTAYYTDDFLKIFM